MVFNDKEHTSLRRTLRKEAPKSERIVWTYLKNKKLGYKFRHQHGIGRYVVDFYCPALKLIIEIDGISHQGEEKYKDDKRREAFFLSKGFHIKRYTTDQVFNSIGMVVTDIQRVLNLLSTSRGNLR